MKKIIIKKDPSSIELRKMKYIKQHRLAITLNKYHFSNAVRVYIFTLHFFYLDLFFSSLILTDLFTLFIMFMKSVCKMHIRYIGIYIVVQQLSQNS